MGLNGPCGASRYLSAPLSYGGSDSYQRIDFLFDLTNMAESPEPLSMIVSPVGRYSLSLTVQVRHSRGPPFPGSAIPAVHHSTDHNPCL